jgi:aminoglycoside phosphotransferase (APT) family kinase protein
MTRRRPEGPREQDGCRQLLVTPRFRTSRHVIELVPDHTGSSVALVVKLPRLAGDTSGIEHEAATLRELAQRWPEGVGSFPEVRELRLDGGRPRLVETGVHGSALTHRAVARRPVAAVQAVRQWLEALPITGSTRTDPSWFARLVETPLERLAQECGHDPEIRELVQRTIELSAPLRQCELPLVFEHGDVTCPNVFVDNHGAVAAVDWELAEPAGLPGTDLLHFLAFVAFAIEGVHDVDGQVRAFTGAFFGPRPWAAVIARSHLRDRCVEGDILEPLLIATWGRYAAHVVPRLHHLARATDQGAKRLLDHVIALDRDVAIWRSLAGRAHTAINSGTTETEWQWAI